MSYKHLDKMSNLSVRKLNQCSRMCNTTFFAPCAFVFNL